MAQVHVAVVACDHALVKVSSDIAEEVAQQRVANISAFWPHSWYVEDPEPGIQLLEVEFHTLMVLVAPC